MSNPVPIYSVVPKSQYRQKTTRNKEHPQNLSRDFDPLNHNIGGQFQILTPTEPKIERAEKRDARKAKEESSRYKRTQTRVEPNEGKVEAYLRQNQMSIRQQQHRHTAVRQAEHRNNLRALPLTDALNSGQHQVRTPSDRYKGYPEREKDREHRRERDKDRDRDVFEIEAPRQSAPYSRGERSESRPVRKSSSAHKMSTEPAIATDQRRFVGREWAFQKIAHCLEQRPYNKTSGALVLGDAGSGKSALCQELSEPSQGPQSRQQRALNRRLLARHFLQSQGVNSVRVGEFIRSVAMQILSHSSNHKPTQKSTSNADQSPNGQERDSPERIRHLFEDQRQLRRHRDPAEDTEDCFKPLLADSEDQRTDDDEAPWCRERSNIMNLAQEMLVDDAPLSNANQMLPEILPRNNEKTTNPFLVDTKLETAEPSENRLYENHENLFLRNVTQRQSIRNSKLARQSSEPLSDKKAHSIQKSLSEQRDSNSETEKSNIESSPPRSRIPVANFHYPNKSELRSSSNENSPHKTRFSDSDARSSPRKRTNVQEGDKRKQDKSLSSKTSDASDKIDHKTESSPEKKISYAPEYLNVQNREEEPIEYQNLGKTAILDDNLNESDEVPPPIPKLPVNPRTVIADAYYEKLLTETDIQQSLLPQNLESDPDECFKKALLFPLLEMDPPKQCLFLLVDAIDEGVLNGYSCKEERDDPTTPSKSVATLLARHQHLFPQWLLLVCTARKHSKQLTKMFTGFRKITLDELQRGHVAADVQRYVLARLDTEPKLRARVSSDSTAAAAAAAALDHLRIKSDGCLLYLEKVLDGLGEGFIGVREIRDIPGTLNGLYLWLAQRLFHGRRFAKVRLLLDVLLAAKTGVTEDMLYKCLLTKEYSVTRDEFNRRLHLLRRILVMERATGFLSIFHHSFARWLVDVKHCTRRYLCSPGEGHAALAMYYTLDAKRLTALEIHNYVYHMTVLEQHIASLKKKNSSHDENVVDPHTLALLWVLDSGCDVESALKRENDTFTQIKKLQEKIIGENSDNTELVTDTKDNSSVNGGSPLKCIMPGLDELSSHWPRDAKVLHTLRELSRDSTSVEQQGDNEDVDQLSEQLASLPIDQEEVTLEPEPVLFDPQSIHELATKGDEEMLALLLKQHPSAIDLCDNSGETALHCAARAGRVGAATLLLKAGANVSTASSDGWSPLRAAAWAGHTEVVEVLLEFGCEVDCVDADNRTALRAAAWSGHEPVVSRLLAAGASPDKPDAEGRTPLIAAAYMGHADIVRALLDAGADIDHADVDGRTALSVASLCSSGGACAALLIERGADVSRADRDGATPLLVAAFEGHTEICELVLEVEADLEASDSAGRTALWAAASAGHASTVRLLLFWGACVDNMDNEGRTVLSTAAAQGNVEVVRQLLDRGLDEHHRDNSGWTPLHYAAFEGHLEVCQALLEAGAKVDEADNDGKGPLMLAAQEGHTHLVEMFLDNWGAPVEQRAHDGKTALRLAALEGHFSTVKALYLRGADPDALDADRRSTLYVLALDNRVAMARFMITECNVHVDTRDSEGRTPLHVSAWQGHTDMVNLLIKVGGAQIDGRDRCARTALHAAAWRGRVSVVRTLLQYDASPAAECTQGATPLGIAAQEGHKECVLSLLQHGADPLQADLCGRTPLKVSWRAGHVDICRLLERWSAPSAPMPEEVHTNPDAVHCRASPDLKRRSVHSSNSTKSSSNLTGSENASTTQSHEKVSRNNMSLSFAQQVARCGPGRRERERDNIIPEHKAVEKDPNLRSYIADERDADLRGYACERDRKREERHGYSVYERDNMSPLYASPPRSPISDICSPTQTQLPFGSQPPSLTTVNPIVTDQHFNRDTHMRIILGRDSKPPVEKIEKAVLTLRERLSGAGMIGSLRRARRYMFKKHPKSKRNGIATNPAMRLVANVRNGLDHAAANIRRTGVALAASTSSNNPAVKTNAFQWRKETPL